MGGLVKNRTSKISFTARTVCRLAALFLSISSAISPNLSAQNSKTRRKVVVSVAPDYPYVLKNGHFEGQVRLEVTVLPNGNVAKVEIKGGNPMFSQYASKAVMQWKYVPAAAQTVEEVIFNFGDSVR